MGGLLFISDDLSRTARLARDFDPARPCSIHDLYDDAAPATGADLVVGDVARLTSDAIVRLRRMLAPARDSGAPLLLLIHGNAARAEAQARLLGASETLPAASAVRIVQDRIDRLRDRGGSAVVAGLAEEARQFFVETFFSGRTVTPDFATAGTALITRAVQLSGIRDWMRAVQRFDEATHRHCLLVTGLAAAFATKLGFGDLDGYRLTKAALLHDVGKTKIPLSILNKPGRLTDDEMAVMRTHAALGYDMLEHGGFSREMLQVVRSHHEMLDGSGYPDGLRAPEIPDLVRLVTICDIYGALIERRPYRPPMSGEAAYAILQSMSGRLDPDLVEAFRPVMTAFDPTDTERGGSGAPAR
ncbi:HD-GYP domain-containing protein [Methylobacterium sp. NMS12]|uniref:HD-GYP domain-containing protein n=1 Tax=Methylobacterium sp. NMS12 TaxID=3079766 RepID=UPI003F883267